MSIIKNSLAFPILNWDWYGYKEWMEIDQMVKEYCNDFEKVKDKIVLVHNSNENKEKFKDIPFKNLDNKNKHITIIYIKITEALLNVKFS